jgi:hypothetical protein
MKPSDPAIIAALQRLNAATAVVYLSGMETPTPVTQAGVHKGKTYYITGTGPHVIGPDNECSVEASGAVACKVGSELELYFTAASEAPETTPEEAALSISKAKRWIEENGGMNALLDLM